jgi:hypothetical protein
MTLKEGLKQDASFGTLATLVARVKTRDKMGYLKVKSEKERNENSSCAFFLPAFVVGGGKV